MVSAEDQEFHSCTCRWKAIIPWFTCSKANGVSATKGFPDWDLHVHVLGE